VLSVTVAAVLAGDGGRGVVEVGGVSQQQADAEWYRCAFAGSAW